MASASKTGTRKSRPGKRKHAPLETEVKLRILDESEFLRRLVRLKARLVRDRVHEMNILYDTAQGNLARQGQMLRLRLERPAPAEGGAKKRARVARDAGAWLTFKGPAGGGNGKSAARYKIREEHEARIAEPEEMAKLLEALGLRPWFRYEKFRATYALPGMTGLKLELDETPVGTFVELEGAREKIDRAAADLGFGPADYINKSYGALFMEACGRSRPESRSEPVPSCGLPDMVFRKTRGRGGAKGAYMGLRAPISPI